MDLIGPISRGIYSFTFEAGENSKNLETVKLVYNKLIAKSSTVMILSLLLEEALPEIWQVLLRLLI